MKLLQGVKHWQNLRSILFPFFNESIRLDNTKIMHWPIAMLSNPCDVTIFVFFIWQDIVTDDEEDFCDSVCAICDNGGSLFWYVCLILTRHLCIYLLLILYSRVYQYFINCFISIVVHCMIMFAWMYACTYFLSLVWL